ncbi:hypothetical protein D9615_000990 [Tricholomella constricta]|uniref:Late embryogenesis abundant protein LEA-2 subgroup domain-containing protein n=1 Tax=Tricholomella constricta TaxID=117010 RepID=A0A8H5M8U4_9AGAR|nr:hypothetical protein D9615_000990 [Tricholomella constricta]
MRIGAFIVSFVSLFVLCVTAAPQVTTNNAIGDIINLLKIGLVDKINAIITLDTFSTNLISVNFDAKNPLIVELTIDRVVSSAGLNGTVYATFDQTFTTPVVVPILGTKNSGTFGNVKLVQGIEASLDIIPFGVLDLIKTDVYLRAATIKGKLGIPITIEGLKQSNIPTTYNLELS